MKKTDVISQHILPTASTMVGVCMTVISIIKLSNNASATVADEILAFDSLLFTMSAIFSYIDMTRDAQGHFEKWADRSFLMGMLTMMASCFVIVFSML